MNSMRWFLCTSVVLLALAAFLAVRREAGNGTAHNRSQAKTAPASKSPRKASREDGSNQARRSLREYTSLPPRAKKALLEFEALAQDLRAGEEVTNRQFADAQQEARRLLALLSGEDLESLIRFYANDPPHEFSLESEGMFDSPLYEAWGNRAPERAYGHVMDALRLSFEGAAEPVALDDPFAEGPGAARVAAVLAGWATRDPEEALAAWENARRWMTPFVTPASANAVDYSLFAHWSRADPDTAYRHLRTSFPSDGERQLARLNGFTQGLPESAPWEALAAGFVRDGSDALYPSFAARWAEFHPDAAVNWILDLDPAGTEAPGMFERWKKKDAGEGLAAWMSGNAHRLPPAVRAEVLVDLAISQQEFTDPAIDVVRTLPPSEHTWTLVERLALGSPDPFADPFADDGNAAQGDGLGLDHDRVQAILNELNAPDPVRARLQAILDKREVHHDPFASSVSESR